MQLLQPSEWRPIDIEALDPAAWRVVRSSGNRSVIAGPGAGKTELLAQRACYLLQTGWSPAPRRILAISFKRDAASNLRDRVRARCGPELAVRFDSFTFDAFAKGLLDRFRKALPEPWMPTADYTIVFPELPAIRGFLDQFKIGAAPNVHGFDPATMPRVDRFVLDYVTGQPLSAERFEPLSLGELAADQWWTDSLRGEDGKTRLMFPMIGRLTELLLRTNPLILSALRASYSHVFMDEFQDTNLVQYELVRTAFGSSPAILTAVGDNKQRIMKWAGALDDIFDRFEEDFSAERSSLTSNYRSSRDLVRIQHTLALAIDEASVPVESRAKSRFGSVPCEILEYRSVEGEADHLAQLIRSSLDDGIQPRDIALLVRQRPQDYAEAIAEALGRRDVRMRNEAELQDILAERLTQAVLPHFRLGCVERSGTHWQRCLDIAGTLWNADPEEDGAMLVDSLAVLHRKLRTSMQVLATDDGETRALLSTILEHLGRDRIKHAYSEYEQGDYQTKIEDDLTRFLTLSCQGSTSWIEALDDLEGLDSIPMMTIHKSKGLEFDTVIFVGLDDRAWWSFRRQPEEARSTFFVAFSRARQRVLFTYCESRGGRSDILSLYELLRDAGVASVMVE